MGIFDAAAAGVAYFTRPGQAGHEARGRACFSRSLRYFAPAYRDFFLERLIPAQK